MTPYFQRSLKLVIFAVFGILLGQKKSKKYPEVLLKKAKTRSNGVLNLQSSPNWNIPESEFSHIKMLNVKKKSMHRINSVICG